MLYSTRDRLSRVRTMVAQCLTEQIQNDSDDADAIAGLAELYQLVSKVEKMYDR